MASPTPRISRYEVITGSVAYGTNLTDKSDFNIYGVGIPPKEVLYHTSRLPHSSDEPAIKQLLLDSPEHQFGTLEKIVAIPDRFRTAFLNW